MKERIYSVLLVSSSEKFNIVFGKLMNEPVYDPVAAVPSVNAARREVAEKNYDLVIVNSPVKEDSASNFALDAADVEGTVVLFIVGEEFYEDYAERMTGRGVFVLKKPTTAAMLTTSLAWMQTAREKIRKSEKKALSMDDRMEEIRLVNRAKWVLIKEQGLDEPEAHRLIEKRAMDRCVPKRRIAEEIIEGSKNKK